MERVLFLKDKVFCWEILHSLKKRFSDGDQNMGIRRSVTEALELPKEIMLDLPLISITGREEVTIENHKGIMAYGEESIRIGTKAGTLLVTGQGLSLKQLTGDALVVTGRLCGLEFLT